MRWTSQQCVLLVAALIIFIMYLWGKKPAVGGSLVSSGEAQQVVTIDPDRDPNTLVNSGTDIEKWGWDTIQPGALRIVRYIPPNNWSKEKSQGALWRFELTLSKSGVSAKLGDNHLGLLYRSPRGEVRPERYKAVGDKPLQLILQKPRNLFWSGFVGLKDPGSELFLGFTDQYLRQDGPAPLVMGSLSDSSSKFRLFIVYSPNSPQS